MARTAPWHGTAATGSSDHLAERCEDELCPRLPCRMFKAGYRKGYGAGYEAGYAAGYGAGYGAGFAAGVASASGQG
jgi:flagellar biosynthesis/type III secretory pathway protein FliH